MKKEDNKIIKRETATQTFPKFFAALKLPYEFTVNGTKIKVAFSTETNAPTIEDALASALCRKLG